MSGIKYTHIEDEIIMEAVAKNGGVFDNEALLEVKRQLPDRTKSSLRNRWYNYLREEYVEKEADKVINAAKEEGKVRQTFLQRLLSIFKKKQK